ncbi:uncharacterized protein LOC129598873 [Paramacrobiotus metropolitanus]|uniref:uncharacterized protein LOC129598873 n=1 Tax=Paramacrobiotus metropolitanus TaxID=2943436 RepID=UPI0024462F7A|nr:uncharacterized protein LOC129598873 [Paramacrobiotus metropolitanus]
MALCILFTVCMVIIAASSQVAVALPTTESPASCTAEGKTAAEKCLQSFESLLKKNREKSEMLGAAFATGDPNVTTASTAVDFVCGPLAGAYACLEQLPRSCFFHLDMIVALDWFLHNPYITINGSEIFRRMCSVPDLAQHLIHIAKCRTALSNSPAFKTDGTIGEIQRAIGPDPVPQTQDSYLDWHCRANRHLLEIVTLDLVETTRGADAGVTYTTFFPLARDVLLCSGNRTEAVGAVV